MPVSSAINRSRHEPHRATTPSGARFRRIVRRRVCQLPEGQRFTTALTGRTGYVAGHFGPNGTLVFLDSEPEGRELAPEIIVLVGTLRRAAA